MCHSSEKAVIWCKLMHREDKYGQKESNESTYVSDGHNDRAEHGAGNDEMKRYGQNETDALAEILRRDGVISVPTDTVYGVCARMDSEQAQERLRDVKHRPLTKAFPIMCSDLKQIRQVAYVGSTAEKVITAFMPGPVTVILKKKEDLPEYVNGGMDTLAVRMATSPALKELIEKTGCPVFMTSANQSGQPVCTTLDEIEKACPDLDAMMEGNVSFSQASTIIDCTGEIPAILRKGPVTIEEILGKINQGEKI